MINKFNFVPNYETIRGAYTTMEQAKYLYETAQMPLEVYQAIVIRANTELRILELQHPKK